MFRDIKSSEQGMGQEIGRSRPALRIQALPLIGIPAAYMPWHIGQLAKAEGLRRQFKATTRETHEL